jgi:hypothetical protein
MFPVCHLSCLGQQLELVEMHKLLEADYNLRRRFTTRGSTCTFWNTMFHLGFPRSNIVLREECVSVICRDEKAVHRRKERQCMSQDKGLGDEGGSTFQLFGRSRGGGPGNTLQEANQSGFLVSNYVFCCRIDARRSFLQCGITGEIQFQIVQVPRSNPPAATG